MIFSLLCVPLALGSLVATQKILPRAPHAPAKPAALVELHNVIVSARNGNVHLYPRTRRSAQPPHAHAQSPKSSAAAVKKRLLGIRQSCPAGTGYCYSSGRCCPDSGSGRCCDDGTCTSSGETCCRSGGACDEGKQCCSKGCAPDGAQCCTDGTYCDKGEQCCGSGNCAPDDGECCSDGTHCESGLRCVIYRGERGCCKDLSCRTGGGGSSSDDDDTSISIRSITVPSFTYRSISIPDITIPSFTYPSITIPIITTPPQATGTDYIYYYTTWTWYYWYYYIASTRITISSTTSRRISYTTSTRITTTTEVSCRATTSSEADSTFASLSRKATFPSSLTASGYTRFVATARNSGAFPTETDTDTSTRTRTGGAGPTASTGGVAFGQSSAAVGPLKPGLGLMGLVLLFGVVVTVGRNVVQRG